MQAFGLDYPDDDNSELLELLKTRFGDILRKDMQTTMQQQLDKKSLVSSACTHSHSDIPCLLLVTLENSRGCDRNSNKQ